MQQAEAKSEKTLLDQSVALRRAPASAEGQASEDFIRVLTNDRQSEGLYWSAMFTILQTGDIKLIWYGKLYGNAAIKAKADELKADNVTVASFKPAACWKSGCIGPKV